MIDGCKTAEKELSRAPKESTSEIADDLQEKQHELTREREQHHEAMVAEATCLPPRFNPSGTRNSKAYGTHLESPILLPALQQVEPSPSTSLLASYPMPLCPAGSRPYSAGNDESGAMYSWAYPKNCIAPSRNRQAMARAALKPVGEKDRPKREGTANDDGYNWRKYGEKQVKGSPYPRSYYKCSYPGCPVKKIVERDPKTGRVSEAAVKGSHNHAKPGTTRGSGGAVRARELDHDSPRLPNGSLYGTIMNGSTSADHDVVEEDNQEEDADAARPPEEANNETAAAALQLLGTGFSPVVQGPLPVPAHYQDTPSSFLPIPASLRNGSIEPEDGQEAKANGKYHDTQQKPPAVRSGRKKQAYQQSLIRAATSEDSEEDYDSEALDSGEDDDAWEASQTAYRCETKSTAAAAMLAANAAAYAAAEEARRQSIERGGINVMLGKRKRKPRRDEDYVDPNVEGEEDEELKVMRNMAKVHRKTVELDTAAPSQKRRAPGATPSPEANQDIGLQKRPPERLDSGLGNELVADERNVVEMETDADNIDDGYRWRKYGQKQVKGNAHPRSYYKCTHPGCNVRKQVERSGKNARLLSTTYEGTHNHEAPSSFGMRTLPRRTANASSKAGYVAAKPPQSDGAQALVAAFNSAGGIQQVPVIVTQSAIGTVQLTLPGLAGGLQVALQPGLQANQLAAALAANHQLEQVARSAGLSIAGLQHWQQQQQHQLHHHEEGLQPSAISGAPPSSGGSGIAASCPLGIMLPPGMQMMQNGQQMLAPSLLSGLQKMLTVLPHANGLQLSMGMQQSLGQQLPVQEPNSSSVPSPQPSTGNALQQAPQQQQLASPQDASAEEN